MAAAGAAMTHVDASRRAIAWARGERRRRKGSADRPIRWITEDARASYVQREVRRGSAYEIILKGTEIRTPGPTANAAAVRGPA